MRAVTVLFWIICLAGVVRFSRAEDQRDDITRAMRERSDAATKLIQVASDGLERGDKNAVRVAVRKLGIMRAVEAVPFLIKNLEFSTVEVGPASRPGSLSRNSPCVFALAQVGSPCFDPLIKRVAEDGTEGVTRNVAIVLKMTVGCDDSIAIIRSRLASETSATAAKRLVALADRLDQHERNTNYE